MTSFSGDFYSFGIAIVAFQFPNIIICGLPSSSKVEVLYWWPHLISYFSEATQTSFYLLLKQCALQNYPIITVVIVKPEEKKAEGIEVVVGC